ncbi:hypothetical protein BX666DRAFT_1865413, partial [Dichotomocladium elegans]
YSHTMTDHVSQAFLFRKLCLSAYFNKQLADVKLVQDLKEKFGSTAVFIFGNWSAPMAQFHEPTCGKGFRELLQKHGFEVYLCCCVES